MVLLPQSDGKTALDMAKAQQAELAKARKVPDPAAEALDKEVLAQLELPR